MKSVRATALTILLKIDQQNAYAAPLLAQVMPCLETRDRRLIVELVYGTLRWRKTLDWIIGQVSQRPVRRIDLSLLNVLRLGAYQIIYLSKIPPHAAVSTSVALAKSLHGRRSGGFINAVLRRIAERGNTLREALPNERTAEALALRTSHPTWLVRRWIRQFGYEETEALCHANNQPPPATLRVNRRKTTREELLEAGAHHPVLREARIEPTRFARYGLQVQPLSSVFEMDWLKKGWVTIQDEGSQLVGEVVSPRPGDRVLDACAGIGGKTLHLTEITGEPRNILCFDFIPWKLKQLRGNAKRLGFSSPVCVAARVEAGPLAKRPIFDKVLLDAPCSNTGVLRRHPERKWHLKEEDIARLAAGQRVFLKAVAPWVVKGGVLVYSTCSLEGEEGEEIVTSFLRDHRGFHLENCEEFPDEAGMPLMRGGMLRTFPHRSGMDGFFCARLIRRHL